MAMFGKAVRAFRFPFSLYGILIGILSAHMFLTVFFLKLSLSDNGVLELGAQWVHGEVGNVVSSMAHKYGLLTASVTGILDTPFVDSTGKIVDREVGEKMIGILSLIHMSGDTMLKEFKGSLGDYYTAV